MRSSLVILAVVLAVSCSAPPQSAPATAQPPTSSSRTDWAAKIADLKARDPVAEATAAFQQGDSRPMGIYGIGLYFPGFDDDAAVRTQTKLPGSKRLVIDGTSDATSGDLDREFNGRAQAFATQYNQQLLRLIHGSR